MSYHSNMSSIHYCVPSSVLFTLDSATKIHTPLLCIWMRWKESARNISPPADMITYPSLMSLLPTDLCVAVPQKLWVVA